MLKKAASVHQVEADGNRRAQSKRARNIDPFTAAIIQSALQAAADEMFAAMRKTAMSAIIYEVLDLGTCVTDADGELASSGQGIPAFVGVLDKSVKYLLGKFTTAGAIEPGDVFVTNDPYYGGVTHLNDVVVAMPVFSGKELMAWTACIAHWNDVGGMVPGSMSNDATEIYQEGLRLPAVKMISKGEPIAPVLDIMYANSRMPDYLRGDLWSGIAAVRLGGQRILEMVDKYGPEVYRESVRRHMDYGEETTRIALRKLPAGQYHLAEQQDSGLTYKVTIGIAPDRLRIDLSDNPKQGSYGPYNISYDGALLVCQMILKALTDSSTVCNGGTFRLLELVTRPGTIFHAVSPAALGFYSETTIRLYDLIWRCLAQAMPERLGAGHFASVCGTMLGGVHADTGRHFSIIEPELGGWGASAEADGINANYSALHGDTYNCPAEICEARYGVFVDQMALNTNGGGAGMHRGGRGVVIDYRIRSNDNFLTIGYTRAKVPPWGLAGGQDGTTNGVEIRRISGKTERHSVATGIRLNKGDVIRITTGNGGGYGNPRLRDRALLQADLRDGLVTAQEIDRIYGGL
jgi:N-methylhydantoinase B